MNTTVIVLIVVAVIVVLVVVALLARRQRERQLDQKRVEASEHREQAETSGRKWSRHGLQLRSRQSAHGRNRPQPRSIGSRRRRSTRTSTSDLGVTRFSYATGWKAGWAE